MAPYDASGVDVTLIQWSLSLTPAERMQCLQDFIDFSEEIWRLTALNRPLEILKTLADHQVEFLVVGGVAAVALGVPIATWDLDVIHNCAPENVKRLLVALEALEVRYWHRPMAPPG